MTFFTPENLRAVTGGRWLQRVPDGVRLHGAGIDSREDLSGKMFIAIRGERFDGHDFLDKAAAAGASLLVVEEDLARDGLPPDVGVLYVPDSRATLRRLAHAYRQSWRLTKVVGITGSAGKSTTKQLVHAALSTRLQGTAAPRSYNNDIGVPLTLLAASASDAYVVVEIGTNAPGEVAGLAQIAEPDTAVITLVGHSHLEGLVSKEGVGREKMAMLSYLRDGGRIIINGDEPLLRPVLRKHRTAICFGQAEDANLRLTRRGGGKRGWWFEVNGRERIKIGLPGLHNAMNGLAALAVARRFGIDDAETSKAFASIEPLPMRMNRQTIGSMHVYNDAYNANPESMAAALDTFTELETKASRRVLILGDMLELGDDAVEFHRQLADRIIEVDHKVPVDKVVLIGKHATVTADVLKERWVKQRVATRAKLTPSARAAMLKHLEPDDAVLIKGSRALQLERIETWIQESDKAAKRRSDGGKKRKPARSGR
jgi:UDP-N-acetylmuramoyl-tripeptide--D-alanyl-D-alanine ligase